MTSLDNPQSYCRSEEIKRRALSSVFRYACCLLQVFQAAALYCAKYCANVLNPGSAKSSPGAGGHGWERGWFQACPGWISMVVFSGLLLSACTSIPQERPAKSENRNPLEYIQILESAERVKSLHVERVVRVLQLGEGDIVADIGSGSGLFTIPMAELVGPEGKVDAVDIEEALLGYVEELAVRNNLKNIETVLADELDPRIPEPVDLVLICDTLSYISDQPLYIQGLTRYLKPGGSVAVIDRLGEWPPHLEQGRYTSEDLDKWMAKAGLKPLKAFRFHENAFFNIYQYPGK